jgi:hypothetical protein
VIAVAAARWEQHGLSEVETVAWWNADLLRREGHLRDVS